jgi:tetratricopeptide (TPR) repeat protein
MSEQEREPAAADAGATEPLTSQEGDRLQQGVPGGGIHAETITQTTNVVSGTQHIGTQINYGSSGPSHKRTPPLQRPRRAEHFVNREAERTRLLADLKPGRVVTVCGLGGMGKTALVAEVLWTLAPAETPPAAFPDGILFYSFYGQPTVTIALEQLTRVLGEEPVPTPALAAQRAFSGRRLLLLLDGAEEADHLEQVLSICGESAVFLTSRRRADAPDPAYRLDLQPLPEQEAVSVVQAFGGEQAADVSVTSRICACVGNLPLALRLVGRYLAEQEEEASEYLTWLEHTPLSALDQGISREKSVSVLLQRSTNRLSATAQRVLGLVGLLALAAFDRALVTQTLELSEEASRRALGELVNYGLLMRQQSRYEVSHPLIHTYARQVLLAGQEATRQAALVARLVTVLTEHFPEVDYSNWEVCERLVPHIQACAAQLEQQNTAQAGAAALFMNAGRYLQDRGRYEQAAPLLQRALAIYEQQVGPTHPDTAYSLNSLARLYRAQGSYAEAEPLFQRALAICEQELGPHHPNTATSLNHLASLYQDQGKYAEAEPLFQRALVIYEQQLGSDHLDMAGSLNNLALLYRDKGKSAEAEPLLRHALAVFEQELGPHHPNTATSLHSLAWLYQAQGKYAEAEPLYQRALAIYEQQVGPEHPYTATTLENYASLLRRMQRSNEAVPLEQRARTIRARRQHS